MAEKSSKVKIVSWCFMVALCVFAGALCLYFFVFNHAPNERGKAIYTTLNTVIQSEEQAKLNSSVTGLGNVGDTNKAQTYAENNKTSALSKKFRSAFLCYCVDREIVDTFKYEIGYLGNADFKMAQKLDKATFDYKEALTGVQKYLEMFNSQQTEANFGYMLEDFIKLEEANHSLAMTIIDYVGNNYYGYEEDLNKCASEKYMLTYVLSIQSKIAYPYVSEGKLIDETGDPTTLYNDTLAQYKAYRTAKGNGFKKEIDNGYMIDFLCLMMGKQSELMPFFESIDKRGYYKKVTDTTVKEDIETITNVIWEGRSL